MQGEEPRGPAGCHVVGGWGRFREAVTFKCRAVDLPCMGKDGLGQKLAFAAVAMGAILLVLRIVGGRSGNDVDEDAIDRIDTGRSDEDRSGEAVETGIERVSTSDSDDDTDTDDSASDDAGADEDDDDEAEMTDSVSEEVPVEATGGRFDNLDLFDYVAIAGAAFEAAREEYRNRV